MNTQALQHALSQLLHDLQQQMGELNHTIELFERRLGRHPGAKASSPSGASPSAKSGGRRSAGWTDAARAQVAARMRDYWRKWREERAHSKEDAPKGADAPERPTMPQVDPKPAQTKTIKGRSTAGWTPQARAQAAARMRDRWHRYRVQEMPCD
jgi:hypothetical protein